MHRDERQRLFLFFKLTRRDRRRGPVLANLSNFQAWSLLELATGLEKHRFGCRGELFPGPVVGGCPDIRVIGQRRSERQD